MGSESHRNPVVIMRRLVFAFLLLRLAFVDTVTLECLDGWTLIAGACYRHFPVGLPWLSAALVCKRYGARLLMLKDLRSDATVQEFGAIAGRNEVWLARLPAPPDTTNSEHTRGLENQPLFLPTPSWKHTVHKTATWQSNPILPWPEINRTVLTTTVAYKQPFLPPPPFSKIHFAQVTNNVRTETTLPPPPSPVTDHEVQLTSVRYRQFLLHAQPVVNRTLQNAEVMYRPTHALATTEPEYCILARIIGSHVITAYVPCDRKSRYLCQRSSAPAGTFHCTNGRFVQPHLTCDGDDNCGDGSDERNCSGRCKHHLYSQSGTIVWPNSSHSQTDQFDCAWVLQAEDGYNMRLQFTELSLDPRTDVVTIFVGGLSPSASQEVARLGGGGLNENLLPSYTSINNLIIITFASQNTVSQRGFRAIFSAVKDSLQTSHHVTAARTPVDLYSPSYPNYLSSQDYMWVITAEHEHETVTLEVLEVDLKGNDRVLVRDGNSAYGSMLAVLTSSSRTPTFIMSTGRHLYIMMQTRGFETGKGFHFRYWQGCSVNLTGPSGEIHSPGFSSKGGNYGLNMTCFYYMVVPGRQTVTVKFNMLDVHPSDQLMIYESETFLVGITGSSPPFPFDISSGVYRIMFKSDDALTGRGFSITYSIACPKLTLNDETIVIPRTLLYRFGAVYLVTCADGYAFPQERFQRHGPVSVGLECLEGGIWNVSTIPTCSLLCRAGWYFNNTSRSCKQCAVGHFQGHVNRTSCELCPNGTTTEQWGASSSHECKKQCPAGQYFNRHAEDCVLCPLGFFQHQKGQFKCLSCPVYKTTLRTGADSPYQCVDDEDDEIIEDTMENENLIIVTYDLSKTSGQQIRLSNDSFVWNVLLDSSVHKELRELDDFSDMELTLRHDLDKRDDGCGDDDGSGNTTTTEFTSITTTATDMTTTTLTSNTATTSTTTSNTTTTEFTSITTTATEFNSTTFTTNTPTSTTTSSPNVGSIVGGVIGAIVGIAVIVVVVVIIKKRKNSNPSYYQTRHPKDDVHDYDPLGPGTEAIPMEQPPLPYEPSIDHILRRPENQSTHVNTDDKSDYDTLENVANDQYAALHSEANDQYAALHSEDNHQYAALYSEDNDQYTNWHNPANEHYESLGNMHVDQNEYRVIGDNSILPASVSIGNRNSAQYMNVSAVHNPPPNDTSS